MNQKGLFFERLSNGVQVVGEDFDNLQSVCIGFFFKSGVLTESPEILGVSHFIEHMMFKGTSRRSAKDIARQFDRIGGYLNAFTAKDYCCYYSRVVKDHLPVAVEVLADMVQDSVFDKTELERERGVILEEIKMYEDSPDEIIHELLGQSLWGSSPLGRPILGTSETVGGISRKAIMDVYQRQYIAENLLVCIAGNFDRGKFLKLLEKSLARLRRGTLKLKNYLPKSVFETTVFHKEIEQVHLAIGSPGIKYRDPLRYAVTVLNTAFGGGMSSRLFQEIREKRGLAYSVYSYHTSFSNTGFFAIYAGTSIEHLKKVISLIFSSIKKLVKSGLTRTELKESKEQIKGNLLMALESTTNRMNRLMTGFLYGVDPVDPEISIEPILKVTDDQLIEAAGEILDEKRMALTIISPSAAAVDIIRKSEFSNRPVRSCSLGKTSSAFSLNKIITGE